MLTRRTDLAQEAVKLRAPAGTLDGVVTTQRVRDGFSVTQVEILDDGGARALDRPVGHYVTVDLAPLKKREADAFSRAAQVLADELSPLLRLREGAPVLVVGLGNRAMTPDAVGPLAQGFTLVTRHLVEQLPEHFGAFRPVSAIATGVLGTTGVESGELVKAVVDRTKPACVIAIDALASRSIHRLCATIQLADTGITPGSGVGNHRGALNEETLGVPVIAIGVPTVVDAATLTLDILEETGGGDVDPQALGGVGRDLFVTPRDIDVGVADAARVIGYGVSLALNTGLSVGDLEGFLE